MSSRYIVRLVAHIRHEEYAPASIETLRDDLGVPPAEADDFAAAVHQLRDSKRLTIDEHGLVKLPTMGATLVGSFRKNAKGFGFVVPETPFREGDLFIPPEATGDALTGDTVECAVSRGQRRGKDDVTGRVIKVVKRKRKVFTGELSQRGSQWLVYPDGRELTDPVVIRDPHAKNAKPGDKVVIEITHYPQGGGPMGSILAEGVIVDVLGAAGVPSVETQATIAAYNLPGEFDERVVAQARRCTEQFDREVERFEYDHENAIKDRDDLRAQFIITIDPPDAKDYDDAIQLRRTKDGWALGVHIADVAHFIPPGTPLDEEAKVRGNSCYLPRLVIPMLPEVLSNGICSLQEAVPRFCKSAFMEYDRQGEILKSGVASTLIKSAKRLTYLEAQALIDGDETEAKKHAKTEPNYTEELYSTLREMDACARAIRIRRRAAGMIHLDLPQVELIYDDKGRVVDAQREDDAFTHTLIEMFMVEANEVLARVFERVKVPLLRRIHPEPTPGNVGDLRDVVRVAGFTIPKKPTRQELQKILDATKGSPAAPAVHFAVLRSLTKAEYSPALVGHYALASEAYAHFTSPIRRYPDLTVHRALSEYLRLTGNGKRPPTSDEACAKLGEKLSESRMCPDEEALTAIGRQCSRTEENAAAAEGNLRSFLVLQLLSEHVGESFKGMVTNCSNAGIFIQIEKYLADGLIKKEDLPSGQGAWIYDAKSSRFHAPQTGRSFAIGDQLTVTIANVDLALRRMDLVVTDPNSRDKAKPSKGYPKRGFNGLATPTGPITLGQGVGGLGPVGPRTQEDWDRIKFGQGGASRRSQKSKGRDKGKNPRRDK